MNSNKLICIILLLCLSVLFFGCGVEHRDIDELVFVLGAVFDYNPQTKLYEVHVQVAKSGAFAKGDGGQQEETFIIYDGVGKTEFDAIRDMAKNGSRFFWGHCEVYVIGPELAKKGIFNLIDFCVRDNEIREDAFVLVADAPVSELITLKGGDAKVPLQSILNIIRGGAATHGKTLDIRIREVFNNLLQEKSSYLIPLLKIREQNLQSKAATKKFHTTGAAVFQGQKIITTIDPSRTRGYNFIKNQIKDTLVDIKHQQQDVVIELIQEKAKIKPKFDNSELSISVEVKVTGNIAQLGLPLDTEDPKIIPEIEYAFSQTIEDEILDTINLAKELRTDFLGFGRAIEKANPKLWASIKTDWQKELFPEIPVNVKVEGEIIRTGMVITTKPEVTYEKRR